MQQSKPPSTAVLITIIVSAVAMIGFIVILSAMGKDTSDALQLIFMIVPVVIIQVLNSVKIEKIETNTNGNLTKRLDSLADKVNAHTSTVVTPTPTEALGE